MRGPGGGRARLGLFLVLATLIACGDIETGNGTRDRPAASPEAGPPAPPPARVEEPLEPAQAVRVWLSRGDSVVPVPRPEAEPSLRSALESLVAGPTAEERRRGLTSWFGDETRDVLRDVRIDSGRAVVEFRSTLPSLIPGAGSSAGSELLLMSLDSTVFQFPSIRAVEYRLDGSCQAFWEWLQRACTVVTR